MTSQHQQQSGQPLSRVEDTVEEDEFEPEIALDPDWWKRLKYELKWENLWHNGDYPNTYGRLNWAKAFGGAGTGCWCCARTRKAARFEPIISTSKWLAWRILVFVYLMGVLLYSIIDAWEDGTWFYYMTNWQTALFALYSLSALSTCAFIQWRYQNELEEPKLLSDMHLGVTEKPGGVQYQMPWYCRVTWVLHGFALSLGIWVTFMFWSGIPIFIDRFTPTQVVDHVTTMLVLVLDFSLAAFPWLLLQFVWSALIALIYFIWTIIHYELDLGNKFEEDARYIYPVVDWAFPERTCGILIPAMFIGIPAFSFLVWILSSESVAGPYRIVPWGFIKRVPDLHLDANQAAGPTTVPLLNRLSNNNRSSRGHDDDEEASLDSVL